jgi:two-component system response regulator LytT
MPTALFAPPFSSFDIDMEPPASGELPSAERGPERVGDGFREPPLSAPRIAARRKKSLVFMDPSEVWAFEADARLTFAHCALGKLDIDVSLAEIEASPLGRMFVRVHRGWLANFTLVKSLEHTPGETQLFVGSRLGERSGIRVPVSRDRVRTVRSLLLETAIGVRRRDSNDDGRLPI